MRCRIGFHAWSRWRVAYRGRVIKPSFCNRIVGLMILQERQCSRCGFTATNKQQRNVSDNIWEGLELTPQAAAYTEYRIPAARN